MCINLLKHTVCIDVGTQERLNFPFFMLKAYKIFWTHELLYFGIIHLIILTWIILTIYLNHVLDNISLKHSSDWLKRLNQTDYSHNIWILCRVYFTTRYFRLSKYTLLRNTNVFCIFTENRCFNSKKTITFYFP